MVKSTSNQDDFFEEDEPIENVIEAFENGTKGVTAASIRSFCFTFVVPKTGFQGRQIGEWTSVETRSAVEPITYVA